MGNSWYSFDVASGWVLIAVLLAIGLSILVYSRQKTPWGKSLNVFMGFLRFAAIFLIILLILNPLLQLNVNTIEKPLIVVALDNSQSVKLRPGLSDTAKLLQWVHAIEQQLPELEVKKVSLSNELSDTIAFQSKVTNLGKRLKRIATTYDDQNLAAVMLLSDGIINEGQSPAYQNYDFPIYTIGLGDTIAPKDLSIQSIRNNKVAYQGNQFPISVNIHQKGFDKVPVTIRVMENNQLLSEKTELFSTNTKQVEFHVTAETAGLRRLTIAISPMEGESSFVNNHQDIYVDVVEGKDKVLILAPAPHPDIHALRSALHESSNYETFVYIPGLQTPPKEKKFDLIIEHQAFSGRKYGDFQASGKLYILGTSSRMSQVGTFTNYLKITEKGRRKDQVKGSYNESFSKFKLKNDLIERMSNYPPIAVPFGNYQLTGSSEVLLYQQVGSIVTSKPLIAFSEDGTQKSAIITGSGLWQWKIQEAAQEENTELFTELVQKTVQYLCIKVNKDRFVVKPREASYQVGDRIFIDTEAYNEIYERAYGNTIQLSISDIEGTTTDYEMVDSPVNSSFNLGNMSPGIYQFKASTKVGGKQFSEIGSFAVRDLNLESINLTANHNLLRSLSKNTGGHFYSFQDADKALADIRNQQFNNLIKTSKENFPLINNIWIILLIAFLLGTEWFLRKYLGAY